MKRSNERSLHEALGDLVDDAGMREKMDELDIATAWDQLVGAMVARHTVSLRLKQGRLRVRVDSAPLRQELTYLRTDLLARLNEHAGRDVVKEIVLE
ncbi:MAG: DUF721 domain-containing protein [Flavobacteriales bacterium]|nr:DUF721 domain-containing protein [Flavobacteriales bacterium]